jgi:hypothetical protein
VHREVVLDTKDRLQSDTITRCDFPAVQPIPDQPFAIRRRLGSGEVEAISDVLLAHQAVPDAFAEDALHIAFAITHEIDFLLSWNFKHIVRRKTKDVVRMVTGISGYRDLEIFTPPELL